MNGGNIAKTTIGMRPQDPRNDPVSDLPDAGTDYQINFARAPYGLPT